MAPQHPIITREKVLAPPDRFIPLGERQRAAEGRPSRCSTSGAPPAPPDPAGGTSGAPPAPPPPAPRLLAPAATRSSGRGGLASHAVPRSVICDLVIETAAGCAQLLNPMPLLRPHALLPPAPSCVCRSRGHSDSVLQRCAVAAKQRMSHCSCNEAAPACGRAGKCPALLPALRPSALCLPTHALVPACHVRVLRRRRVWFGAGAGGACPAPADRIVHQCRLCSAAQVGGRPPLARCGWVAAHVPAVESDVAGHSWATVSNATIF